MSSINTDAVSATPILVNYLIKLNKLDESLVEKAYVDIMKTLGGRVEKKDCVATSQEVDDFEECFNEICKILKHQPDKWVAIRNKPISASFKYMIKLVEIDPSIIGQACDTLLNDELFMRAVAKANPDVIERRVGLFKDINFVASLIESNWKFMDFVPDEFVESDKFMLRVITAHPQLILNIIDNKRRNNRDFMRKVLTANADAIKYMLIEECDNEFACTTAAKSNITHLKYLSKSVKEDHDKMISIALTVGWGAINYACEELLMDACFLAEAIGHFGNEVFVALPINYKTNTMVIKLADRGVLLHLLERGSRAFTYEDIVAALVK